MLEAAKEFDSVCLRKEKSVKTIERFTLFNNSIFIFLFDEAHVNFVRNDSFFITFVEQPSHAFAPALAVVER